MDYQESDLTTWIDGHAKPVRPGVYMLESGGDHKILGFQQWDGETWGPWRLTPEQAAQRRGEWDRADLRYQNDRWRGLKKRPNVRANRPASGPLENR